jgi:Flp pilus assembly protein TadD
VPTTTDTFAQAQALHRAGRVAEAVAIYQQVLAAEPVHAEALGLLGVAYRALGRRQEAVASLKQSVRLNPQQAEAHYHLGGALADLGQLDEAAACCRRALELWPGFEQALHLLAFALKQQGRLADAADCCRRVLELKPDLAEAHNNLAIVLRDQNKQEEAASSFRRAVELRPDYAEAHNSLGRVLLTLGRFAEGWPEYEWRLRCKGMELPPLEQPCWTGAALDGQTILLRSEQGMGDTLQFIRYAALVKQQGGTVLVEVPPALKRLVATCHGVDGVIATGETRPKFDVQVPLLSLPGIFGTSLETIPASVPYLWPDEASIADWNRELGSSAHFRIGIAWQGNPARPSDRFRSIPLAQFAGLAQIEGVQLYSLQMGAGREQLTALGPQSPIVDLAARLGDFYHTAALVRNLDLVISCDSAPTHLAGALGVPAWLASAVAPDWRWLLERSDSPWYPSVQVFRQSQPGDWSGVFQTMAAALRAMIAKRSD